jgi:hypothetical protein
VKVSKRTDPKATDKQLQHGIPVFLDQLVSILRQKVAD